MVVKMENKNKTFKAWITYQALYAHFTREYDYFKYNGKLNMSEYSMETQFAKYEGGGNYSAQRQIFSNLGNTFEHKEDLIFFFFCICLLLLQYFASTIIVCYCYNSLLLLL